ncbi:ABC transporter substrate-binding protein [Bacillus timonensis]|uniref:ABC transporter substrate-binding protein n=1 Tax=Bacillus timonensis TaxID=1033734 RepID=UPI000289AE0A|nr:ABC transporter substrate-binding protein [Bacillus timonensis]
MRFKKSSLVAGVLSATLLLGACGTNDTSEKSNGGSGDGKVVVDIFQFKPEIADQFKALTDIYTEEHPNVTFNIQTVGGGADYGAALKAQFASNDQPDIFNNGGYQEAITWQDKLEDLSDQPWVKDAYPSALEPMTVDGKLYGQPVNLEGYGYIYNKDLFEKAGITDIPKTLSELETVSKKLKDAGITPFSNGYAESFVIGQHLLNLAFAQQEDPDTFIQGLHEGKATIEGNEKFDQVLDLLDLTVKYGNKNPLTTDYNTQVTLFATGEAAMMQQGNWTQPMIDKITPDMNIGFIPMPINDDEAVNDKLQIGVPSNWVVNKNAPSADKEAAKDFLNWLVSSEEGKKALVEEFKFIPAFKNIPVEGKGIGILGEEIVKYSNEGKTLSWNWFKWPEGSIPEFGASLQGYVGGQLDRDELSKALDETWVKLKR